jgi:hypothetical protein
VGVNLWILLIIIQVDDKQEIHHSEEYIKVKNYKAKLRTAVIMAFMAAVILMA